MGDADMRYNGDFLILMKKERKANYPLWGRAGKLESSSHRFACLFLSVWKYLPTEPFFVLGRPRSPLQGCLQSGLGGAGGRERALRKHSLCVLSFRTGVPTSRLEGWLWSGLWHRSCQAFSSSASSVSHGQDECARALGHPPKGHSLASLPATC